MLLRTEKLELVTEKLENLEENFDIQGKQLFGKMELINVMKEEERVINSL